MTRALNLFGSTRLAVVGLITLALVLLADSGIAWVDLGPAIILLLSLLGFNLLLAFFVYPRLRRDMALLLMHLALLTLLLAAALGRLHRFEGHVEVMQGTAFDSAQVVVNQTGPWHHNRLEHIRFVQDRFTVDYAPGVRRSNTAASVRVPGREDAIAFGDDHPLQALGYRFYTTHNKGFGAVLDWQPDTGVPMRGAVHFPSYPLFDWKQGNDWQLPSGESVTLWLHLDNPLPVDRAWSLASDRIAGRLAIGIDGLRQEIAVGESADLPGGQLRLVEFRGWMGWRIFYDPALMVMLWAASIAILALLWHVVSNMRLAIRASERGGVVGIGQTP